jgi:hypothetical protein
MAASNSVASQIIVAVVVALVAGGSAPWWWPEIKDSFSHGARHQNDGSINLPHPNLRIRDVEENNVNGTSSRKYRISVTNWDSYPAQLFNRAPDLPPCGLNRSSSRTWVSIYNAINQHRIYGFCSLTSPSDLNELWFYVGPDQAPPQAIYIVLEDRRQNLLYFSNTVQINH